MANLVFLIDVSGSMNAAGKLPLVQFSLMTLINTLQPTDTIGIVVYAGHDAVLLEPTAVSERGVLLSAIQNLSAGGSTYGEGGIRRAYDLAQQHFRPGGINRVILCTDGDFNVGLTGDALLRMIERFRRRDITLTVLGFGREANDRDMEQLADRGNGSYAFIDTRNEALRVLERDLSGTLQVIAQDVKVQVIFNPEVVERFRLIGYENRVLAHQDFENDAVDAAEIGSGQFVTAFLEYELREGVDPTQDDRDLATVRLRYKRPRGAQSIERRFQVPLREQRSRFDDASAAFRFSAAVVEFGEILRHSTHSEGARFNEIVQIAEQANWSQSPDAMEFVELVRLAQGLWQRQSP
jgi:Ca-activated chloride channel family protein